MLLFLSRFYSMEEGVVIRSTGSWYTVRLVHGTIIDCRIKGQFRIKGIRTTNPVAVGDRVRVKDPKTGNAIISDILPRNNYIIRKSVNLSKESHIIASNIDQTFLIVTVENPGITTGFIDRFLVTAEAYRIPSLILFNKVDACSEKGRKRLDFLLENYTKAGYRCFEVSAVRGDKIEEVRDFMKGKSTLFSGHSGVGKSTLANAVDNNLNLRVGEISEAHSKGRHTTTFAEMFELEFGGFLIDTPGVKGFGIVDIEKEELAHYFAEMRPHVGHCKFNNCMHINEPKCVIKEMVAEGEISEERYRNYLNMYYDDDQNYRTSDYK